MDTTDRAEKFAIKRFPLKTRQSIVKSDFSVDDNRELREACIVGYEQAEADTIRRACEWLANTNGCTVNMERFRMAMENE